MTEGRTAWERGYNSGYLMAIKEREDAIARIRAFVDKSGYAPSTDMETTLLMVECALEGKPLEENFRVVERLGDVFSQFFGADGIVKRERVNA